jgi:GNAT superfamily N-acetyltransferase
MTSANGQEELRPLALGDGQDVPVRLIQPEDAPALQRLHSRCSEETVYLRFFGPIEELSDEKAQYFAHVDGTDRFALVALDPDEQDEIIAVARFDREIGTDHAEYSALVEDSWQGRGLGQHLTQQLLDDARDRGIRYFYGLVMTRNTGMLKLLRGLELPERELKEKGAKYVEVEIQPEQS